MYVRPRPRFRPRNAGSGNTPSLALEFNQLSALPSYVTFSRGTQAMQYGSDGTLQYAPNNLLTYSNQADNAAWTKSNSFVQQNLVTYSEQFDNAAWTSAASAVSISANVTTAPDGTVSADSVTAIAGLNFHYTRRTSPDTLTGTYTYSFYVKKNTSTWIFFTVNDSSINYFNLDTGTFGTTSDTCSVVALANGWYRIIATRTLSAAQGNCGIGVAGSNGGANFTAAGTESVYIWGAQLVQGSVPGDYRATTSAALPVLYADYTGALRARKLSESSSTSRHECTPALPITAIAGAVYNFSIEAKAGERTAFVVFFSTGETVGDGYAIFNLAAGTVNFSSGATASIAAANNGYYRCSLVVTTVGATLTPFVGLLNALSVSRLNSYAGDGSSGIYIADAQLTPGYLPLAVTETTSAAVYGPRFDYDPSSLVTQNLLLYSEQFDNAVWNSIATGVTVTPNTNTAPNGTFTADSLAFAATISYKYQTANVGTVTGRTYTFSCWVWSPTGKATISLRMCGNITGTDQTFSSISLSSTPVRATITRTFTSSDTLIDFGFDNRTLQGGDGIAGTVVVWGAQLNRGSTALPYTATTTAPYTLTTARGLLIEEQRTNLLTYSDQFDNVIYSKNNSSVTANAALSPDGATNADALVRGANNAAEAMLRVTTTLAVSTTYTLSIYAKAGTAGAYLYLRNLAVDGGLPSGLVVFNLANGTIVSNGATYPSPTITSVGNGWYRCAITGTTPAVIATNFIDIGVCNASGVVTGNSGDTINIYGAQLEAGAFATSYIPTVASTATRNADSASITTLTPWFNAAAGTVYSQIDTNASAAPKLFSRLGPTISGSIGPYATSTNVILDKNGTGALITSAGTLVVSNTKTAWAYDGTNVAMSVNGGAVATAAGALGTPADALYIGRDSSAVTNLLNGHIQSLRYYPTRLPNASLQSITV